MNSLNSLNSLNTLGLCLLVFATLSIPSNITSAGSIHALGATELEGPQSATGLGFAYRICRLRIKDFEDFFIAYWPTTGVKHCKLPEVTGVELAD